MTGLFLVIAVLGGLWLLLASSPSPDGHQTQYNCWSKFKEKIEGNERLIAATSTIFIAVFTVVLAVSTAFLWWATKKLVSDAEEATQRQLRAYVYLDITGRKYPPPPHTPTRYAILFGIKNSGTTWARNVRIKSGVVIDPPTADPFDAVKWKEIDAPPTIVGPGQRFDLQLPDLQFSEQREVADGKKAIYYVVWITYEDVFAHHPPVSRTTQLSSRLIADIEGGISFSWMPTHNCADDDCP
jgi:hypothetical protein